MKDIRSKEALSIDFDRDYIIRPAGPGLWQAFNRHTNEPASVAYTDTDAIRYYVQHEIVAKANEEVEKFLTGECNVVSVHDVDPLYRGLSASASRNGTKEKL